MILVLSGLAPHPDFYCCCVEASFAEMDFISITNDDSESMDIPYYLEKLRSGTDCQGLSIYIGTVTAHPQLDTTKTKKVKKVQYDVPIKTAEAKMKELCGAIRCKWPGVSGITLVHRIGYIDIGGAFMFIGITGHDIEDSKAAVSFATTEIGKIQFWKEETYQDDTRRWTSTHECYWRLNMDEAAEVTRQYGKRVAKSRAAGVTRKACPNQNCPAGDHSH